MRPRTLAIAAAAMTAALLTTSLAPAQAADPTFALSLEAGPYDRDLRIAGPHGYAQYLVVAGLQRQVEPGPFGLQVVPLAIVQSGTLDPRGHALVPLDLMDAAHAGLELHFQAIAAPVYTQLADDLLVSDVVTLQARAPETQAPRVRPDERIYVAASFDRETAEAHLVYIDGDFAEVQAEIELVVPTGGYVVGEPVVRWDEDFARISITLQRPHPDDLVSEGFVAHPLRVSLGSRVDQAEVAVLIADPEPPAGGR